VKVDLRIVTATLKNLDEEVAERRFREDLRARLMGVRIELPPLRARREDLGWLIATLLERAAPGRALTFAVDAVAALYAYDWPLNIRELERALTAAAALARGRIELEHLPAAIATPAEPARPAAVDLSTEDRELRANLLASLERNAWNLSAVSRELAKDRKQIQRWIKRFALVRA
jgi:transcriptional regulator of acetoin/glycerol metabolism